MTNSFSEIDEQKTLVEHSAIILTYQRTGFLDKENAINKYKDFNIKHPDYYALMMSKSLQTNTSISIENADTDVIIQNLSSQLLWLVGEEYLKSIGINL